jgi:dTMP kinase
MAGLFLSFEGVEGGGKSTQLRLLEHHLREAGFTVTVNIEPGGTAIGKQIRRILLEAANAHLSPVAELLLFFASRAQAVDEVIRPSLEAGHIVLSDRYTDSTLVYQGVARGLGVEAVRTLETIACRGVSPQCTLVLDMDVEAGLVRARARNSQAALTETRLDDESLEFHRKVRQAYHDLAGQEPGRVILVDAARDPDAVFETIRGHVEPLLAALR